MTSQFDPDGRYFAQISDDGILKIWNTAANSLEQEYVPDIHLVSPCTCLHFVECLQNSRENGSPKNKKRKRREFSSEILLGTSSGKLLIYSISKGDIKCTIDGNISLPLSCLSPNLEDIVYSGMGNSVGVWNIRQRSFLREWKVGNDKISAILAIPNSKKLLTASKSIKLWNSEDRTLLKTFTGHSSDVNFLHCIPNYDLTEPKYVISGSKSDRVLNCWNISDDVKEVNTTASLLSEDYVYNISLHANEDGSTKLSASVANGAVHIFEVAFNGRCIKPIKPKSTIKVVADTGQEKKGAILPILIFSSHFRKENSLLIAHGSNLVLTFEELETSNKKLVCLLRQHPHTKKPSDVQIDKVITPIIGNNATYLTPYSNVSAVTKRKLGSSPEITMERRLENLTFNKDVGSVPRSNNMAHLLLQGLRSKDKSIIETVLHSANEEIIRNTLETIPINVIMELVSQLETFIQGYNAQARAAAVWLKLLLEVHVSLFISNPELPTIFAHIRKCTQNRLASIIDKRKFKMKLDLLLSGKVNKTSNDVQENEDEALIFNDRDSSSESEAESKDSSDDEEFDMDIDSMEEELSD
ncbi:WD repeat-containing protein 43 [Coccinella septempunctata]|uniref:WD repeat-containing protein 43 n=1 Tax=Coccinella septempunctata TaxID=41139 RepID=UPI001D0880BA|nr:WD repeat-containing protein 43 [Coccinella septempunctata]